MNKVCLSAFSLILVCINFSLYGQQMVDQEGAVIRSDTTDQGIYLFFSGHDYVDGFEYVMNALDQFNIQASFFFTGDFIRNNVELVKEIAMKGHFVGPHSDKHLLYCDWNNRDSLLYSENRIKEDISLNLNALHELGIYPQYFMPPYEWYNKKVVEIAAQLNLTTVNFTSGTRSNADYTTPEMTNYISSDDILKSINDYRSVNSMNGFHLLIHPGISPDRQDKFYYKLKQLIAEFQREGYRFSKLQ